VFYGDAAPAVDALQTIECIALTQSRHLQPFQTTLKPLSNHLKPPPNHFQTISNHQKPVNNVTFIKKNVTIGLLVQPTFVEHLKPPLLVP
jgi:hypothetical protein